MRTHGNRKLLAFIMTLCMVLQMTGGTLLTEASAVEPKLTTSEEAVISLMSVTGSAIIYYVGGASGSNTNTGTDSTTPFATLSKAAQEINQGTPGTYEVVVLGDTYETEQVLIGDGVSNFDVTIHAVSGSAIVMRDLTCTGDMITVTNHASLSLGNETESSADLTIHGGRGFKGSYIKDGRIIKVDLGGSLSLNNDTTLCENYYEIYSEYDYPIGDGGAIYNSGTLLMYGGTIRDNYAHNGTGVYNTGTFKLYGGSITDNHRASYGSGVYNAEQATFEMYGGLIADNDADSYAGGVGNFGVFKLFGGTIDGNYANSNGGVYNGGTMEMSGGTISNNKADFTGGGILNGGYLLMSGGTICNNISDAVDTPYDAMSNEEGGGISNYDTFVMTGGTIEGNDSEFGGAVYVSSNGTFHMSGGTIQSNTAIEGGALYCEGNFIVSGNVEVPGGIDNSNDVYVENPVTIGGMISSGSVIPLSFNNYSSSVGSQWLRESTAGLIADNYEKFLLMNPKYQLTGQGVVEYIGQPTTYYVGGLNASDTNDGTSQSLPFATLQHALEVGNDDISTFLLQSDQEISSTVNVKGDITIRSNISECSITKSGSFNVGNMFYMENSSLTLGNREDENLSYTLIIDGESIDTYNNDLFLIRSGSMNLYDRVIIKNNNKQYSSVISNLGTLNMYGGSIEGNTSEVGIIINYGIFNMSGGSIHNNTGIGVHNSVYEEEENGDSILGSFHMSGGSIYSNTADTGRGIYNEGNLTLSGSASFPVVNNQQDDAFLNGAGANITVEGNLSTADPIWISKTAYIEGEQVLCGEESLLQSNYSKFRLANTDFSIDEKGIIRYNSSALTFYVNAAGADSNEGSITAPFATLDRAVSEITSGVGTIVLQSDITITEPVVIEGTITLLSDGSQHTIYRGTPFMFYSDEYVDEVSPMFLVYGKLSLGTNVSGDDKNPSLVLDGGGEKGIKANDSIVHNLGTLNLYAGVILRHNYAGKSKRPAVSSEGNFTMYGGSVQNNISSYRSGVYISGGTFLMNGGTISNNIGRMVGVIIYGGEFIMNGGTINENDISDSHSSIAGVYLYNNSNFYMNGGTISENGSSEMGDGVSGVYAEYYSHFYMSGGTICENTGAMSGVYAVASNINLSGGTIRNNSGNYAGVMAAEGSNIKVSGGSVEDNTGIKAGIILAGNTEIEELPEGILELSGGIIGGNVGSSGQSGIILHDTDLLMSGNPVIETDNKITLLQWQKQPVIKIVAPLTGTGPVISIDLFRFDEAMEEETQEFIIGRQLLVSGEDYTFAQKDVAYFQLADPAYGINPSGKIGTAITDHWITIYPYKLTYDGKSKTVDYIVQNGGSILAEETDYTVSYKNNYAAGTASLIVTGIGVYAGIVYSDFIIDKAIALSIQTQAPATKMYSVTEQKTEGELLQSITLSNVLIQADTGYYYLPIVWNLTQGTFDPKGGTYTYTGTVQSSTNIHASGLTLRTQIIVQPETPFLQTNGSFRIGTNNVPYRMSYYKAGDSLNVEYDLLEEISQAKERIILPITSRQLVNQLAAEDVTTLNITIPLYGSMLDNADLGKLSPRLGKDILKKAKELGKDVTIKITDDNGKEIYSWTFTGENLKNSKEEITDVDLFLEVKELTGNDTLFVKQGNAAEDMENVHGLVIDFGQEGTLPSQARVRIYVGDREGITPGSRIYLYHHNPVSGKLDSLPFSTSYIVDEEGYISIEILHCSDYVMLLEEAPSAMLTSLRDQITVSVESKVIEIGRSTNIIIVLPKTLELLDGTEDEASQSAVGGVTATYRSTKEKIATIDRDGKITAKEAGTVTIYTTVTLYSGKTKIYRTTIRVKK